MGIRILVVGLFFFGFLLLRERHRTLARLRYRHGEREGTSTRLGPLQSELDDVFRRMNFSGRVQVWRDGERIRAQVRPPLTDGDAQSLRNVLGMFAVRSGVIVPFGGRLKRRGL